MTPVVLDSSAVLAYLQREPGWEQVEAVLTGASLSAANAEEVATRLIRRGQRPAQARQILELLDLKLVPVTPDILWRALDFAHPAWGLSLGDRLCLATAASLAAEAWTADRAWTHHDLSVPVRLIRP